KIFTLSLHDALPISVNASSVSGNVEVGEIAGTVSAKSVSGNVQVEIVKLDSSGNMDFSTVSGNVSVSVPGSLDAEVELSAMSGEDRKSTRLNSSHSQ